MRYHYAVRREQLPDEQELFGEERELEVARLLKFFNKFACLGPSLGA